MANCVVVQFTTRPEQVDEWVKLCSMFQNSAAGGARVQDQLDVLGAGAAEVLEEMLAYRDDEDEDEDEDDDETLLSLWAENWRQDGTQFTLALMVEWGYEEEFVGFLKRMFACLPVSQVRCSTGDGGVEDWADGSASEILPVVVPKPAKSASKKKTAVLPPMPEALAQQLAMRIADPDWQAQREALWQQHRIGRIYYAEDFVRSALERIEHYYRTGEVQLDIKGRDCRFGLRDALKLFPVRSPEAVRYLVACFGFDADAIRDFFLSHELESLLPCNATEEDALFDWMFGATLSTDFQYPEALPGVETRIESFARLDVAYIWLCQINFWLDNASNAAVMQPAITRRLGHLWQALETWPDAAFRAVTTSDNDRSELADAAQCVEWRLWPILSYAIHGFHARGVVDEVLAVRRAFVEHFVVELEQVFGQRGRHAALKAIQQVRQRLADGKLRQNYQVVLYFRMAADVSSVWRSKLFEFERDDRPYRSMHYINVGDAWISTDEDCPKQLTQGMLPVLQHFAPHLLSEWLEMTKKYRALSRDVCWDVNLNSGQMRLAVKSGTQAHALLDALYALFQQLPVSGLYAWLSTLR